MQVHTLPKTVGINFLLAAFLSSACALHGPIVQPQFNPAEAPPAAVQPSPASTPSARAPISPEEAAYRQRLAELEEELQETSADGDFRRIAKMQEEMAFLKQHLAAGVGWRGHARRAVSHTERARVNITNGIRAALTKIAEHDPSLSHYLSSTITTGLFCSFTPDLRTPITWRF